MSFPRYLEYKDSGVEWIGQIPNTWNKDRIFAHFYEFNIRGGNKDELLAVSQAHGVLPQAEYEAKLGRRLSQQESGDYSNYKRVNKGDFIYNKMRMWQGAIGVAPCAGIVSPAYVTFRPRNGNLADYWVELFKTDPFLVEVNRRSQGICDDQNSCNYEDFREIHVPVAPIQAQQQIVAGLKTETTRIDALIEKKTRFIELLKEKRQALITQAVTQGLDPNVKMKDSGVEWIGAVPAHWLIEPFFAHTQELRRKNIGMIEDNVLSLSFGSIIKKPNSDNLGLAPESYETYQIVLPSEIIFRLTDLQNDKRSLRSAIVRKKGIITSAYLAVKTLGIDSKFFSSLMRAYDHCKVFYSMGGGLRQSLKYSDMKWIPILLPPESEQARITSFIDRETTRIDALMEKASHSIALLKERRAALITAAVTGQIDLREAA